MIIIVIIIAVVIIVVIVMTYSLIQRCLFSGEDAVMKTGHVVN